MTDPPPPLRLEVIGKSDVGRSREHNEDTFLLADLSTGRSVVQSELIRAEVGPRGFLLLVADGLGGAAAGELASSMAADLIYGHLADVLAQEAALTAERFAFHLREAVELANLQIHTYGASHPEVRGMGSTVTAAGIFERTLYLAQVGDSRAYLIREGTVTQLTKDQSLTQRLVDAGALTEDEAAVSDRRNIILQALGPDPHIKVEVTFEELQRGDHLVLCSDGLSGSVRREEIGTLATERVGLAANAAQLIALANERGGPDNITVVLACFDSEAHQDAGPTPTPAYRVYTEPVPATGDGEEGDLLEPSLLPASRRSGSPRTIAVGGAIVLIIILAAIWLFL